MNRRNFIEKIGIATSVAATLPLAACNPAVIKPFYIATWNNENAVKSAISAFKNSKSLMDGIEKGINYVENDPNDQSVGLGGRPDREGNVTLDACIMDETGNAGSVCFVKNYKNPISIARKVMDETPHVIMAGDGAEQLALEFGFKQENLLTEQSKKEYKEWLIDSKYKPIINIENHDTIGMLGIQEGKIVGGCSTSGLSYKMHGRVGDSPIIGAGLFVDNEVGACVATGLGEKVLTSMSAFLVVELMRSGMNPTKACEEALNRIRKKENKQPDFQVGLIAVNAKGEHGGHALYSGFNYVIATEDETKNIEAKHFFEY